MSPISPTRQWREWWNQQPCDAADPMAAHAASQGFVVATREARELGWAPHDIQRELRRGTWWAPSYGTLSPVRTPGDEPVDARRRHAVLASAGVLRHPGHVVAARSAVILHGLPTMGVPNNPELAARNPETTGRRSSAHIRVASGVPLGSWFGVAVQHPASAVVDAARFDRRDGVMAGDAALRDGLVTNAQLMVALRSVAGFPGVRQAADVLEALSPLSESPLESITRLAMRDDGFPTPELQVEIRTHAGSYRVDMLFREQRLIIEIDGLGKYTGDALQREKLRESRLRAMGYTVERVTWEDVVRFWPQTRARLWAALAGGSTRSTR